MECLVGHGAVSLGVGGVERRLGGSNAVATNKECLVAVGGGRRRNQNCGAGVSSGGACGQDFRRPVISCRAVNTIMDAPSIGNEESSAGIEKNQFPDAAQSENLDSQSSDKDLDLETAGRWTSDSWAGVAGYQPPLTAEDEATYTAYVQDLLTLEAKRSELEEQLGRLPTEQEWADSVGISVLRLFARMGRGRAAKRKMVEANLRLVHSLAHQFHGQGLSHTELCQEGVLGLLKSTERFDCTRQTKFSSYAFFWVKEQMGGAVKKFGRALRMAQSVSRTVSLLLRHKDEFEQEHGRKPTLDELVEVSEVDAKRVQDVFRITVPVKSLDASADQNVGDDGHNSSFRQLVDTTPSLQPWLCVRDVEQRKEVTRAIKTLKPQEQQIMHLRYGLGNKPPLSRSEVAKVLGVTYETIRNTEKGALKSLRESVTDDAFMDYLNDNLWK